MKSRSFWLAGLLGLLTMGIGAGAKAELAPLQQSVTPSTADILAGQSATADMAGEYEKALQLADKAIRADSKEAWGYYARGDALASLRRVDEALAAFRRAEQLFPTADGWGRSIAIWGEANVLRQAGRCGDASRDLGAICLLCWAVGCSGRSVCAEDRERVRLPVRPRCAALTRP